MKNNLFDVFNSKFSVPNKTNGYGCWDMDILCSRDYYQSPFTLVLKKDIGTTYVGQLES